MTDIPDLIKRLRFSSIAGGSPLFDEAADVLAGQEAEIAGYILEVESLQDEVEDLEDKIKDLEEARSKPTS